MRLVLENISRILAEQDVDAETLKALADVEMAQGHYKEAIDIYRQATLRNSSYELYEHIARAAFPGVDYRYHLAEFHLKLKPKVYVEIGVFQGETLGLARSGTSAIGIDPAPRSGARRTYVAETEIHTMTSDEFFKRLDEKNLSVPGLFDLVFIDGLHHFDQVIRDFINVERYCHAKSVVVFHDTLPIASQVASRERASGFWCGDVWPIVRCLLHYRPELIVATIPTFPSGLTIVSGLDARSNVLSENLVEAFSIFTREAPSESSDGPWNNGMNGSLLLPNDPDAVVAWICDWIK